MFCLSNEKARADHARYGMVFHTTLLPIWKVNVEVVSKTTPCVI